MIIRIGTLTNKNNALGLRRQFSKGQGEQEDNERLATARMIASRLNPFNRLLTQNSCRKLLQDQMLNAVANQITPGMEPG